MRYRIMARVHSLFVSLSETNFSVGKWFAWERDGEYASVLRSVCG